MTPLELDQMFKRENDDRAAHIEGDIAAGIFDPEAPPTMIDKLDAFQATIKSLFDDLRRTNATFRAIEATWCKRCGGSGFDPEDDGYEAVPCYDCGGTGKVAK